MEKDNGTEHKQLMNLVTGYARDFCLIFCNFSINLKLYPK